MIRLSISEPTSERCSEGSARAFAPRGKGVLVRGGDWYLPVLRGSTSTPGRRVLRTRGPAHDHGPKEGGQGERPAGTAALQAPRPLRRAPNDLTASPACAVWCKGAVPCLL